MLNLSRIVLDRDYMYKDKALYSKVIKATSERELKALTNSYMFLETLKENELDLSSYEARRFCNSIKRDIIEDLIYQDLYVKSTDLDVQMRISAEVRSRGNYDIYYIVTVILFIELQSKYNLELHLKTKTDFIVNSDLRRRRNYYG